MSGNPSTSKEIAVLSGPELSGALRLAGIRKTRVIERSQGSAEEVNAVLREWMEAGDVGVIVISEEFSPFAHDFLQSVRQGKRILPVLVEVPSPGTRQVDAVDYYRKLSRDFLGLEIELKEETKEQTDPSADGESA